MVGNRGKEAGGGSTERESGGRGGEGCAGGGEGGEVKGGQEVVKKEEIGGNRKYLCASAVV